jgi:hypothetical protein
VDTPLLQQVWEATTHNYLGINGRFWKVYSCNRCGGLILCGAPGLNSPINEQYPATQTLNDEAIPQRARSYLEQAISSLHAPAGAVMLAASAVDAMLKAKGYKEGSLYVRINQAVKDHLITEDMGKWAHEVRLDANDQRHVEEEAKIPVEADAKRVVEFTKSLAMFLFVLPAMVTRGIKDAAKKADAAKK